MEFGIQLKQTKRCYFATELNGLGHHVTQEGHFPTEKGVETIRNFPCPQNATAVKKFLGMCGFFRSYIPNFSNWSLQLHSLLRTLVHERVFSPLKASLTSDDLILLHSNWNQEFELHTDASKYGCGAMFAQYYKGELRPIRYASRAFNPVESHCDTVHQELFATKWALGHWRPYVLGHRIKVVTDHANLQWLKSIKPQQSKLACWCLAMAEYNFYIEHKLGVNHVIPDTLSRYPIDAFSVGIPECTPAEVTSFITTAVGFDIPYPTPYSVTALFSSSLQCLYLASNHIDTVKPTLSSLSSLANVHTCPHL